MLPFASRLALPRLVPRLRPPFRYPLGQSLTHRHLGLASEFYIKGSGPIDPGEDDKFDILINDINLKVLLNGISDRLGHPYLSRVPDGEIVKPINIVNGILFGIHDRPFFSFPVLFNDESMYVHFLFDTASPATYVSNEVSESNL